MLDLHYFERLLAACRENETLSMRQKFDFLLRANSKFKQVCKEQGILRLCELNVLDYNGLYEVQSSHLFQSILEYKGDGDYPLWRSFLRHFFSGEESLLEKVDKPIFTTEEKRIDICVRERGKYAFVFENKLKGAVFQRNQIGRYLASMEEEGFDLKDLYLVVIPSRIDEAFLQSVRKSVRKAPEDWHVSNEARSCGVKELSDQYTCRCDTSGWEGKFVGCAKCVDFKKRYEETGLFGTHVKVLGRDWIDWLNMVARGNEIPENEYLLRSAIIQFSHYVQGLYQIRLNKEEIMKCVKVLETELDFDPKAPELNYKKVSDLINDLGVLQQSLARLQAVCKLRIWQQEIERCFPGIQINIGEDCVKVPIEGISCGLWINGSNKFYWGFYYDDEMNILPDGTKRMVADLIEKSSSDILPHVESKGSEPKFLAWNYTSHGAERIKDFLKTAVALGYKYQKKEID